MTSVGPVVFPGSTRSEVVEMILRPFSQDGFSRTVVYSSERDGLLWTVEHRISRCDDVTNIACYEIVRRHGHWGYANWVEGAIPHLTCPTSFFEAAPCQDRKWRDLILQIYRSA